MFFRLIHRFPALLCLPVLLAGLSACSDPGVDSRADAAGAAHSGEDGADPNARAEALFERVFEERDRKSVV